MTRWSEENVAKLARHLESKFAVPPDEFRPVPWLCYTGKLTTREIYYAVDQMYAQGIRSFFIFPIYGMEVPYLSPRWFQIVKKTVAYCAKKQMTVWIYDDYNWPNGSCAGLLIEKRPDFTVRSFRNFWSEKIPPGRTVRVSFWGNLWGAFAVYEKGDYRKIPAGAIEISPYKGEDPIEDKCAGWKNNTGREVWLLVVASCPSIRRWVANKGSLWLKDRKDARGYTDLQNEEASKAFIQMTHAAYYKHLKKHFGKTLKGFFDDEPQIFGVHDNPRLFQTFHQRYGYRLEDHLEELFLPKGKQRYRVRADFWNLAGEFFAGHMRRLNDWCAEHGVDSTGHYLGEESPQAEISADGAAWPVRKEMSVPGLDLLGCETNYEPVPARRYVEKKNHYPPSGLVLTGKLASATARYLGVPRVMCEAYGCMPYWVAPVDLAIATQWLSGLGTNLMNDNLLTLSFEGFRKRAQGGRHFTTPWWKYYKGFAEFAGRCSLMATAGQIPAKIGLIYPALTAQCLKDIGVPRPSDDTRNMLKTNHACQQTAEALLRGHWDWEIVFEELIEKGNVNSGRIKVPHAEFSALVVPGAQVLAEKVFARLEKFAASGGLLVFTGPVPSISIDPGFNLQQRLKKLSRLPNVAFIAFGENESWIGLRGKLNDIISKHIQPAIKLLGSAEENILVVHRQTAGQEMFHLVNMSSSYVSIQAAFQTKSTLEIWHPDDGRRYVFSTTGQDGNYQTARLDFAPWEGFFVMTSKPGKALKAPVFPPRIFLNSAWSAKGVPSSQWKIRKDRPAMARLKAWARLDPEDKGLSAGWIEGKPDKNWTSTQAGALPFNLDPEKSRYVWFKYCFFVQHLPKDLGVVVDNADYQEVYLNGMRLSAPRPFVLWDGANLRFDLALKARKGWNMLTFKAPISEYFHKDVVLTHIFAPQIVEPVVLTGDFRSCNDADGRTVIIAPRNFLYLGSWNSQDLADYCGSITYSQEIAFERNNRETWLDLGDVQMTAELRINGKYVGRRLWPPYQFRIDSFIKEGQNKFEVTVANGLNGVLGAPGWSFMGNIIMEAPSGLIGPVRILTPRA